LDALTIIWKRLSWLRIRLSLSSEHLDAVFSLTNPLSEANTVPFVRFLHSMMVSGFLDQDQTDRVENGMNAVFYQIFLIQTDEVDDKLRNQLGQLAEIAMALGHRIILANYKLFEGIVGHIHLLSPVTATLLLSFFDSHATRCNLEFLKELPCDHLIELIQRDDPPLVEASLNLLSLVIERQCTDPDHIVGFIIPKIIEFVLDSVAGETFSLSRAAIRFVHAIVGRLSWMVLPRDSFRVYMTRVIDLLPSESAQECILFLDCLLSAMRETDLEFMCYAISVCDELHVWDHFDVISTEDLGRIVDLLCDKINEARTVTM
jgi:hypothetical protein